MSESSPRPPASSLDPRAAPAVVSGSSPAAVPPPAPYARPLLLYSSLALMMLIWCGNYPVAKAGYREIDGLTLGVLRVFFAGVVMLPMNYLYRRRHPLRHPLRGKDYLILGRLSVFGVALNQILFIVGLSYTTVGHSSIIVAIGPVNILLLAWLMGLERLRANKVIGIGVAFAGVALLATGHGFDLRDTTLRGDILTLCGSLSFSLYAVFGKKVAGRYGAMTLNAWNYFLGALMVLPLVVWRAGLQDWSRVTWRGWGALAYVTLGASVIAYFIWYWALKHLAASRVGVITYIQPVLGTLIGVYLLHERFEGQLALSAVLVLTGVALTEWHPAGAEAEDESVEEAG